MEIFKLLKANIQHKKGAFKSIIVLMTIIVFSFSGTVSNNENVRRSLAYAHSYANTPTFNMQGLKAKMQDVTVDDITAHPDVTDAMITDTIFVENAELDGKKITQLLSFHKESEDIYRVFNNSCTGAVAQPEPLKAGEIYLPYTMSTINGAKIGSVLVFGEGDNREEFVVKGFVEECSYGSAFCGFRRVFISDSEFERLYDNADMMYSAPALDFSINLKEGADYAEVKKELNDMCGLVDKSHLSFSMEEMDYYTMLYSETGSKILYAFLILLLAIVVISIWHSISTSIELEYTNLGILKAQGFTSGKIRLVYILQYLIAEAIGAVIGIVLSIPALSGLGILFQKLTGIITVPNIAFLKCALMALGTIALTMVFVVLVTAKIAKISPVRAISGGKSEVHFDSHLNFPIKAKPLSLFMGIRQFTSRMKSYGGSVLIVTLLVFFIVTVSVFSQKITRDVFEEGSISAHITVYTNQDFTLDKMEEMEQAVLEVDADAKALFSHSEYLMVDDIELQLLSYNHPELLFQPIEGRLPVYDNEIVVTDISAEMLGKDIGDTVLLGGEESKEFLISGIFQCFNDTGKAVLVTTEGMSRVSASRPLLIVELSDVALLSDTEAALQEKHGALIKNLVCEEDANASEGMANALQSICDVLLFVVYAISVIFTAVVISMICSKAFIKERIDIGILKAMGFTSGTLRLQFAFRFLIIAIIGAILGVISSCFLTKPLLESILRPIGLTKINSGITLFDTLLPTIVISASFFLFAYITARKTKAVEVRELISE